MMAGRQLAERTLGALRPPLFLRRPGAASGPFRRLRHDQQLGDLLPQHRIVDLPGRSRPLQERGRRGRHAADTTCRAPSSCGFRPAPPRRCGPACRRRSPSCAAPSAPRRSCISVVVVTAQPSPTSADQESGSTLASVKNTWLNEAWPFICRSGCTCHARLLHVEDEIRQALVLRLVPIGARQQQTPMRLVRAGGPHLLAVDHPLIAAELGARHRAGHVGAAARLAEQLAPDVLAGQDAQQELLLLQIGAVRQDGRGGQRADADLGDADGADALEFLLDHRHQADRQVAAVPARRPMRRAPAGFGKLVAPFHQPVIRAPVGFQPGADFGADGVFG